MTESASEGTLVKFIRRRDYRMVRELGRGACGQTVLLHDDVIDHPYVCKKFVPYSEDEREALFDNFMREIKLLHLLHHDNVVRVFSYYVYPEQHAGYIVMEFVDGTEIGEYATLHPEHLDGLFVQAVKGFAYLEERGVLHRDIRPANLMVTDNGALKIIDLGFGKRIANSTDFEKSITLNLWCERPAEFELVRYDYTTEVYFVGKLFEKLVRETSADSFKYSEVVRAMCKRDPSERLTSFAAVSQRTVDGAIPPAMPFTHDEIQVYRKFSNWAHSYIARIKQGTRYKSDLAVVLRELASVYSNCMLEDNVPNRTAVIRCFLDGTYYFNAAWWLEVDALRRFMELLGSSESRGRTILANLYTRLDSLTRYEDDTVPDDEVPF